MRTRSVDADGAVTLVAAIVRGVPSLPGAACVGRWELFDEVAGARGQERRELERQRVERAAAVCRSCPARPGCPSRNGPYHHLPVLTQRRFAPNGGSAGRSGGRPSHVVEVRL